MLKVRDEALKTSSEVLRTASEGFLHTVFLVPLSIPKRRGGEDCFGLETPSSLQIQKHLVLCSQGEDPNILSLLTGSSSSPLSTEEIT